MKYRNNGQRPFSETHPEAVYSRETRKKKAATITHVLQDYLGDHIWSCSLLDVGCSTGIIADFLSAFVEEVVGIDTDRPAIQYAKENFGKDNVKFSVGSATDIRLPDRRFDVVICAQIYEHVLNPHRLMQEIERVLKPGGLCYFTANNRFQIMEPHYRLPFLSIVPRPFAHLYTRFSGRGSHYPERHLSYWGLKRLTSRFQRIDYTKRIIDQPEVFSAEYMIKPGTLKWKLAKFMVHHAYWLCPGYVWLLRKEAIK